MEKLSTIANKKTKTKTKLTAQPSVKDEVKQFKWQL
jgi:hypothetical protein